MELGKRSKNLAMTCYSDNTISTITSKLPFMDVNPIYNSELEGQAKLEEILSIIKKRKINALR